MHDDFPLVSRRSLIPAWSLSVGVHVLLLVCLSLLAARAGTPVSRDERAREVGIVIARQTADQPRQYFDDVAEETPTLEAIEQAEGDTGVSPSSVPNVEVNSLVVSDLALPSTSDIPLPGAASMDAPRLSVSNARPQLPGVDQSEIVTEEQAKMCAARTRGPTTELGLFGSKPAVGGSFVFLIDRSQSMGGGGLGVLQDAERELVRALQQLAEKHRFQVVVYHDKSVYLERRELLPATPVNKALVPGFLSTKAAFGATEHERAIMSALALEPDVIFLLTDGGEPHLTNQQIREIARLASPTTAIHCLQFGAGPLQDGNNFLARLAAATGGEYGYIDVNQRRQ